MYQFLNSVTFLASNNEVPGLKFNFEVDFIAVIAYVLLALGLYAIAKRRGISKPWLAWIPFGQTWILGSISDQYRYVVMGERKSKRKVMLALEIILCILAVVMVVVLVVMLAGLFAQLDLEAIIRDPAMQNPEELVAMIEQFMEDNIQQLMGSLGIIALTALPLLGVALALVILQYMAYHDLFASCDPKNKTLFTTLGIILDVFGLSVVMSAFVLVCKNKDAGMPPRADEQPVDAEPAYAPVVDAAAPVVEPAPGIFSDENAQQ